MRVEVRFCDACRAEVDANWPIRLTANAESNPTGEFLSADFCSVDCCITFMSNLTQNAK